MKIRSAAGWLLAAAVIGMFLASPVAARDAAFIEPSAGSGGPGDDAVKAEPKNEIDIGETNVNMARRVTVFFSNTSGAAVQVEKVNANADANVLAEIANDDCTKQGSIAPQSRCTVEVSVTPSSPGSWAVELLLTHNGAGRIARAKIIGKTSGTVNNDRKETGLEMSAKEITPINFGDMEVNSKAVRTALMVNDSADPITLLSIDLIEASNGLTLLDQGCAVDLELKPGETCPVTLVWSPTDEGQVSTDLIIRHSGRQGFTVLPVRGKTKGLSTALSSTTSGKKDDKTSNAKVIPPTTDEILKAASLPQISADALAPKTAAPAAPVSSDANSLKLIGTVGNKGLLLAGDGTTKIVMTGDDVDLGNDQKIKVTDVSAKSIGLLIDGKKKELKLGSAQELVTKASTTAAKNEKKSGNNSSSSTGSSTTLTTSSPSTSAPAATAAGSPAKPQ
jgi:hypothetical protein